MGRLSTDINWVVSSFPSLHLAFVRSYNPSSLVKVQSSMMKLQIRKLGGSILGCSWSLLIGSWSNIVRIISTSRMSLTWINIDHHGIVMLSISSNGTSCSLSNLIGIILIGPISISSFSIIWRLIDRFIPPIPRIIHSTLRNLIWIWLLDGSIRHVVTCVNNCLI